MKEEDQKIWKEGYEQGVKMSERRNEKAVRIGNAILDVLYDIFETKND